MSTINDFGDLGSAKGFKMTHLNVRSLVKKIDQLRLLLRDKPVDIFTVSETWLQPHLSTGLAEIEGYNIFRLDRKANGHIKKRGGGLLTYINVKHSSYCESLEDLDASNQDIEAQWIYTHRQNCKDIVICNVYRPPTGNLNKAISHLEECLQTLNMSKTDLFILGDLNVNYKNMKSPTYKKLHFFVQANGLTQYINSTTRNTDKSKSLIDLAMTNSKFVSLSGTLDCHLSDHQPIFIVHKKGRDTRPSAAFSGRSYRNYDRKVFGKKLKDLNWDGFFQLTDADAAWDWILHNIVSTLDLMCPIRSFHIKNYRPDWMTKELIEQIKDRDYFYKQAKLTGDEDLWNIARHLRNVTNFNIRQAKKDFILNELKEHDDDAKKFWKVIRKVVPSDKSPSSQDVLLKHNGERVDRSEVAAYINDYFINVGNFKAPTTNQPDSSSSSSNITAAQTGTQDSLNRLKLSEISEGDVLKIVKEINISKSSGLDNISSFIIKEAFEILLPMVTFMFNLSIGLSRFPDAWKQAMVVPIPKSGNLTKVQNYRPISLLPLPGKLLEKLVQQQLSTYLETEALLMEAQYGFRKNRSTVHSAAQLLNYVNKKLDSKIPTLAVYVDFRKAFDCVQHPVLLEKLANLNLSGSVVDWVDSYLSNRKQQVYANDTYSSFLPVTQGVPQGSVLGPLFYIIYANDIPQITNNCEIALYADDTVLYTANTNFQTSVIKLQKDMDALSTWCRINGIKANTDKTKVMVFGSNNCIKKIPTFEINVNGTPLSKVTSYKYLGITLDEHLNYNLHLNKTIGSVSGKLKQFRRMRGFLNTKAAVMVYKSMLLPILEYGDIFFCAASVANKKRLQTLQNKALRCALGRGLETSTEQLHAEAGILKLKYRREQHLLNYMFDRAQNHTLHMPKSSIKTRSQNKKLLKIKRPFTEKFKKSLAYLGPKTWNSLPDQFHSALTKNYFKAIVSARATQRAYGQEEI